MRGGKLYTFGGYHNDNNSSYKYVLYTYSQGTNFYWIEQIFLLEHM